MTMLLVRTRPHDDESLPGYLLRLAGMNGLTFANLMQDAGIQKTAALFPSRSVKVLTD